MPEINQLTDLFISNPDDNEVKSLTYGLLGQSTAVCLFIYRILLV